MTMNNMDSHTLRSLVIYLFSCLAISGALVGCGSGEVKKEQTLSSFEDKKIDIRPQDLPASTKKISEKDAQAWYEEFVKSTNNQELKAKALERLADIKLESQQNRQEQVQADVIAEKEATAKESAARSKEKAARAAIPSQEKQMSETAPSVSSHKLRSDGKDEATDNYAQVAKQYETLLARYPNKKGNDRILYQLARAYDLSGQMEKTLTVLNRLAKEYPRYPQIEEVQFRRGEILFSLKKFSDAASAYAEVMVNKDSTYYERALYKHGWSLFKQGKLEDALISYFQLLDLYFKEGKRQNGFSRSEEEVVRDTLRVVSLAFSFQDGPESIKVFTDKHGKRPYEYRIYERLSELYIEQERLGDAADSYKAFVENNPNDRHAPEFLVKVIDIYKQGGYAKALSQAKADLVTRYGASKFYWNRQDKSLFQELAPSLKENLIDLAGHYHALGQKTKKENHFQVAEHWYREYVNSFPGEAKTAEMNFLLAEVLNELKRYGDAAAEYEKTAYQYKRHEKSAEAGYASILAYEKVAAGMTGAEKNAQRIATVKTSLKFADTFPADPRSPDVVLKAAEELLDMKKYGDASIIAQRITSATDKKSETLKPAAWAIIATAEFEMGHHENAELATLQRLNTIGKDDKDRKVYVERLAAAIYKQGEAAREKGKLAEAANHFLRIEKVAPSASIIPTAMYDAAAVLVQANDWKAAIPVLQGFIKLYPNHKFNKGAVEKLAVAQEKENDWGAAAKTYEKIYQEEQDVNKKQALLWQTAEYYQKAKNDNEALKIYKVYVSTFTQPLEQAIEARQRIADIYKAQKQIDSRHYWLKEIVKANEGKETTERTQFLAAMASMELAEPKYTEYTRVKLVQPLKKNLKIKKDLLKETIDAYTKAASYGVAEITTASTFKIAEVYNEFSKGLYKSERPKGLSDTELEQYDLLLEEQAYPFEEKAIEIHETNAERVVKGIYDEWVKKSFTALEKLNPVRYAKSEKSETFTSVMN